MILSKSKFELLVDFHQSMIRTKLNESTINLLRAELKSKGGDLSDAVEGDAGYIAKRLASKILTRYQQLTDWKESKILKAEKDEDSTQVKWGNRIEIYKEGRKRTPAEGAFNALFVELYGKSKYYCRTALANGVNPHSVKVLKKRFEHWDTYSAKLSKLK